MNSTAGTGHFYTTDKNKRTMPDKLEMKKYDPVARKHVIYKEAKIEVTLAASIENPGITPGFLFVTALFLF